MAYTIGRFGTDIPIQNPSKIRRSGDEVELEGWAIVSSAAKRSALIQQLNGLKDNPDEPVAAFVYSYDTSLQGFYRIESVTHALAPAPAGQFKFTYSVSMTLIAGGLSLPEMELIIIGAKRSNAPAAATQVYWTGLPDDIRTWSIPSGSPLSSSCGRAYEATPKSVQVFTGNDLITYAPTFTIKPENYYNGSAYLKMGDPEYYVMGRQIDDTPTTWELGNGIVTIGPPSNSNYACNMQFRKLAGGANTVVNYDIELGYITAGPTWNSFDFSSSTVSLAMITCLRNSPEECRVRLTWGVDETIRLQTGTAAYRLQLDIALRRGARGASLFWNTNGSTAAAWGFTWQPNATFVAIDADNRGIVQDVADADSNKRLLIGAAAVTLGTASGRIYGGSVQSFGGFAGYECDSGTAADSANGQQDQYYAAMAEKQRVLPK